LLKVVIVYFWLHFLICLFAATTKNSSPQNMSSDDIMSSDASSSNSLPSVTETEEDSLASAEESERPMEEPIEDLSSDPDAETKAVALKEQGNIELVAGHYLQAIARYSEGLQYAPTNAILLSNRAFAYIKVENYGLALVDADHAIASDPTYAKAFYRRASANYALNHCKLARKDFRAVVKLKPKDKDARAKLAACEKAIREAAFAAAIEAEQTAPLSSTFDTDAIEISDTYDGPHPSGDLMSDMDLEASLFEPGKLPLEFVMASIERFRDQKLIHKRYVARLLLSCRKYFAQLSSLMEIAIPVIPPDHTPEAQPHITVCGDTHGQFYDVLHIFELNGYPHRNNPYLFNGDFVDRGSFSVEVILTYLMLKLHDPECIYLTRGNHETKNMNKSK
jgi:serine/threonine-protein phosphatase 5